MKTKFNNLKMKDKQFKKINYKLIGINNYY